MNNSTRNVQTKVTAGLKDKTASMARRRISQFLGPAKVIAVENFPLAGPLHRQTKALAIANLRERLEEAVRNLENNGCQVYRAQTSAEAVAYARKVIKPGSLVVKSKSNAAKETGVLEALAQDGVTVIETDMGDRICQIGNIPASHPLGPALHVPVGKVAELFAKESGHEVAPDPDTIVSVARDLLRDAFFQAQYGISGANAIAADTGSIILTENEGNIRLGTNLPPVHIVFAGIEKIVPTLEEAIHVCHTAALYGTGASVGGYINVVSGPGRDSLDGPLEMHVILLEEGRWEATQTGFSESLACINCGACLNVCPVYKEIGEQYGYKYFGGIGIIHTALRNGIEKALDNGLSLCVGCRRCVDACPGNIPTPDLIQKLRQRAVSKYGLGRQKTLVLKSFLGGSPSRTWRWGRKLQSLGLRRTSKGEGYQVRFPWMGVDSKRLLPTLAEKPAFLSYLEEQTGPGPESERVAYFAGCLNNLVFPEVAGATLEVLKEQGVTVYFPHEQVCCGYPMQTAGELDLAKEMARRNMALLTDRAVDRIIVDCPTCGTALRGYAELLLDDQVWGNIAREFSPKVRDIFEFLSERDSRAGETGLSKTKGALQGKVSYHQPCHLKYLGLNHAAESLATIPGLNLDLASGDGACCGFGGVTSLEHYDLVAAIASRKVDSTLEGTEILATACPGCMVHLADGLFQQDRAIKVKHAIELLAESYRRGKE